MKSFTPKLAVLSAAVILALPAAHAAVDGLATSGGNARNLAMQSSYFTLHDDANIWANPAYVGEYAGRAYIEHTEFAGANIKAGPGVLGVYFGRNYGGSVTSMNQAPISGTTVNGYVGGVSGLQTLSMDNKFDLLYAMDLGSMKAGARLNYNSFSSSTKNPISGATTVDEGVLSASDINISAGIAMKDMPLDVSFVYGMPSLDSKYTFNAGATTASEALKHNSAKTMALLGRFEAMKTKQGAVLLSGLYASDKGSSAYSGIATGPVNAASLTFNKEVSTLAAYATYNNTANNNQLVAVTTGLERVVTKQADIALVTTPATNTNNTRETTTMAIPVKLAYELTKLGESQKWAVRGSMKKNIYTSSTTKNTTVVPAVASTTTESSGTNAISFGIGAGYVATKGLTIDAAMNQSVLFAGTNWLSTGAGTLIGRLSITYEM